MQQIEYFEGNSPEIKDTLIEFLPVKAPKKLDQGEKSDQSFSAMDLIGLSWLIVGDDDF